MRSPDDLRLQLTGELAAEVREVARRSGLGPGAAGRTLVLLGLRAPDARPAAIAALLAVEQALLLLEVSLPGGGKRSSQVAGEARVRARGRLGQIRSVLEP